MKLFGFSSSNNVLPIILLIAIISGLYFNTLYYPFVWDDDYLIIKNTFIKNVRYTKDIFSKHLFYFFPIVKVSFYRPTQTLSYLFDYYLWRLNPFGYHLTNIAIHIINTILVYLLISILFKDEEVSLLASLLFAICPLHVSAITYISGRADLILTFFMLFSLLLFIKSIQLNNNLYYIGSLFCFLLALLSKESVLIFPFILLLTHKVYKSSSNYFTDSYISSLKYIPFFLFTITYMILRTSILNFSEGSPVVFKGNPYLSVITFLEIILSYIKLIFLPINLHVQHRIQMAKTIFTPFSFLSIASVISILVAIIKTSNKKHLSIVFWALNWFLITLIPVFFVMSSYGDSFSKGSVMMAEHWLYFPLIGFFGLVAFLALALIRLKAANLKQAVLRNVMLSVIISIIFFYVPQTIKTNTTWKDSIVFYSKMLKYDPDNIAIRVALAKSYLDRGNLGESIKRYKGILDLNKNFVYEANIGLGAAYFKSGNFQEALKKFTNALNELKDTPRFGPEIAKKLRAEVFSYMGIIYFYQGLYSDAEKVLTNAIKRNPLHAPSYAILGVVFAQQGQYTKAIANIKRSLEIEPYNVETYSNLGLVYANMGDMNKAKEMWQKAKRLDPKFIEPNMNVQRISGLIE